MKPETKKKKNGKRSFFKQLAGMFRKDSNIIDESENIGLNGKHKVSKNNGQKKRSNVEHSMRIESPGSGSDDDQNGKRVKKRKRMNSAAKKLSLSEEEKDIFERCRIDPETIKIDQRGLLGRGYHGIVKIGYIRAGFKKIPVAVRKVDLSAKLNITAKSLLNEVQVVSQCNDCPFILSVFGLWFRKREAFIVTDYCEKGNLSYTFKKNKENIKNSYKYTSLIQVAKGIKFLHNLGYCHRNITSFNILIGNDGKVKLSDFLLARKFKDVESITQKDLSKGVVARYGAPESFGFAKVENPRCIDVYSFGLICWEVWTMKIPFFNLNFRTHEKMGAAIHSKRKRPSLDDLSDAPKEFVDLVEKCWTHEPSKRFQKMGDIIKVLKGLSSKEKEKRRKKKRKFVADGLVLDVEDSAVYEKYHIESSCVTQEGEIIAKRATGCVRKAQLVFGMKHIDVILKEVALNEINNTKKAILKEVQLMVQCDNRNILKCFGLWFEENHAKMVLEACPKGSLDKNLKQISSIDKIAFLLQICRGVRYLHSKDLVHRNLNMSNMLIHTSVDGETTIKITDFKTAKSSKEVEANEFVGRPGYVAPEVIGCAKMGDPKLLDIFSLGIIFWELWAGEEHKVPVEFGIERTWISQLQLIHQMKHRPKVEELEDVPKSLLHLMQRCWDEDPQKRPETIDLVYAELKDVRKEIYHKLQREVGNKFQLDENDTKIVEGCLLDAKYIEVGDLLGQGGRGSVRAGYFKLGFQRIPVAIKEIVVSEGITAASIIREVRFIRDCDCRNIVKCFGLYFKESSICVVTELCGHGDLHCHLRKGKLQSKSKIAILIQIAKGMDYLHNVKGIAHRDLKSGNILIGNDRKLKISDFDAAKHFDSVTANVCGTPEYVAPELFGYSQIKEKKLVDVYSFGILIWEVWTQSSPYKELKESNPQPAQLIHQIHSQQIRPDTSLMKDAPPDLVKLAKMCWMNEPHQRVQSFLTILSFLEKVKGIILKSK